MKVDVGECERQRKEYIMKNEKYIRLEVVIGKDLTPYCYLEAQAADSKKTAALIRTIENVVKTLYQITPDIDKALKGIQTRGIEVFQDGEIREIKDEGGTQWKKI